MPGKQGVDSLQRVFSVQNTLESGLCLSCGICKEVCRVNAIDLVFEKGQYVPRVSEDCIDCGVCLDVCPGYEVSFSDLYGYEGRAVPEDGFLGPVLEAYIGHAKDEHIRTNSASGGMVTAIITELLHNGSYKGAFVLPFESFATKLAKTVYTEDVEQVLAAAKSKYLPASVENVASQMADLSSAIVVGTPCQIHGLKKMAARQGIDSSRFLFLGLFCEKTLNYNLLSYYQWKYVESKIKEIAVFDYRSKEKDGWPGHTKLKFNDSEEMFVDRKIRMALKKYFQLQRCLYCIDKLNQLADISFGDCYTKGEETTLGQSNILVRTEKGAAALNVAKENLVLKPVAVEAIERSQKIAAKRQNLDYCHLLAAERGHQLYPDIQERIEPQRPFSEIEHEYQYYADLLTWGQTSDNFERISGQVDSELRRKAVKGLLSRVARMFRR